MVSYRPNPWLLPPGEMLYSSTSPCMTCTPLIDKVCECLHIERTRSSTRKRCALVKLQSCDRASIHYISLHPEGLHAAAGEFSHVHNCIPARIESLCTHRATVTCHTLALPPHGSANGRSVCLQIWTSIRNRFAHNTLCARKCAALKPARWSYV